MVSRELGKLRIGVVDALRFVRLGRLGRSAFEYAPLFARELVFRQYSLFLKLRELLELFEFVHVPGRYKLGCF